MPINTDKKWDVFISHASEDKEIFVRSLAVSLQRLKILVWYDEFSLMPGDSLSRSIDKGLFESKFGLAIISYNFIKKPWTEYELRGLVAREIDEDKVIIPIWLNIKRSDVIKFSPPLADKIAIIVEGNMNIDEIAIQVIRVIRPDIYKSHSREELQKIANGEAIVELQDTLQKTKEQLSEYQCPTCSSPLLTILDAPSETDEDYWDVRKIFQCGYTCFGEYTENLCPSDPSFPSFDDYELKFMNNQEEPHWKWHCFALPKTDSARKAPISSAFGETKEESKDSIYKKYLGGASKYEA